jgi:plasmid stability protein
MATITVRNVPEEIMAALRELASRNGRSMEQQVRDLLAEVVVDRQAACDLIEAAWGRQERATRAEEVAAWIARSRP